MNKLNKEVVYTIELVCPVEKPGDLNECMEKLREFYTATIVDAVIRETPRDVRD